MRPRPHHGAPGRDGGACIRRRSVTEDGRAGPTRLSGPAVHRGLDDLAGDGDDELGGVLAWYSTHHTPPRWLPAVFAEFHRTLAPGGYLLWGGYAGDERLHSVQGYGRPVSYASYLLPLDRMVGLLEQAGLVVTARLEQEPGGRANRPHACLLARKPERP